MTRSAAVPAVRRVPWAAALAALIALACAGPSPPRPSCTSANAAARSSSTACGSGGLLSPLTPPSIAAGAGAGQVAVSPDGKSVYVTMPSGIAQFDLLAGGLLTPKNPPVLPVAGNPIAIAVSPDGTRPTSASSSTASPSSTSCAGGGTLAPKATPTVQLIGELGGVTVSPDGKSVYVGVTQPSPDSPAAVAQYDVGAGGALSPKSPPPCRRASARAPGSR